MLAPLHQKLLQNLQTCFFPNFYEKKKKKKSQAKPQYS